MSFRRCDWLFPPSARQVSPGNRSNYKSTRERVDSKGLYGRWRLHLMGSWLCSVCEKSFSRKDNMQRHVMSKHRNAGLTPFQTVPIFSRKCQRFRFEHPFTSMIAGMTGSGKTAWVRSLLQPILDFGKSRKGCKFSMYFFPEILDYVACVLCKQNFFLLSGGVR